MIPSLQCWIFIFCRLFLTMLDFKCQNPTLRGIKTRKRFPSLQCWIVKSFEASDDNLDILDILDVDDLEQGSLFLTMLDFVFLDCSSQCWISISCSLSDLKFNLVVLGCYPKRDQECWGLKVKSNNSSSQCWVLWLVCKILPHNVSGKSVTTH